MSRKKVLIIARSFPTGRMEFKQSLRVLQYFLQTEQNLSYFSIVLQIQAKKKQNKTIAMYNEGRVGVKVGGKIPIPTPLPICLIRTLMTMQLKELEDFQF